MKKLLSLALSLMMVAFVLTGCAKAKDAAEDVAAQAVEAAETGETVEDATTTDAQQSAPSGADYDTASAFYTAYTEAKSDVLNRLKTTGVLSGSVPKTLTLAPNEPKDFRFRTLLRSNLHQPGSRDLVEI